ncbi:MAG: putative Na+/H+ antiporter [candidate division Zixibacteria bacterium]|nr:putative Na+/H+ antiporter [candidate division Zixibacteria bacterium]
MNPTSIQIIGTVLFCLALIHTFSTKYFEHLAHTESKNVGLWHLLGEVEIVFGFWAMVLMLFMFGLEGKDSATAYLDSRNFTEPMFVFAVMVIAGSKPILQLAQSSVRQLGRLSPFGVNVGVFFCVLALMPLLGSFITEPAAMTVAALTLQDRFFGKGLSTTFKYATIGVLFVNISIGGTLTPYAAPPVLMVAGKWGWDISFMLAQFGWKAALAVVTNAGILTLIFHRQLRDLAPDEESAESRVPFPVVLIHLFFLASVVVFAHSPKVFMGLLLFFLGFTSAYPRYQDRLILREGLLVAFFLAGLVVLGGQQQWWLQALLTGMSERAVYFGATALTAITDNAALTYLGSLVQGLSPGFKYALVAGAVTGGGLTVIANAPNPAGFSILREHFPDGAISPLWLLVAAVPPTIVALVAFWIF